MNRSAVTQLVKVIRSNSARERKKSHLACFHPDTEYRVIYRDRMQIQAVGFNLPVSRLHDMSHAMRQMGFPL